MLIITVVETGRVHSTLQCVITRTVMHSDANRDKCKAAVTHATRLLYDECETAAGADDLC